MFSDEIWKYLDSKMPGSSKYTETLNAKINTTILAIFRAKINTRICSRKTTSREGDNNKQITSKSKSRSGLPRFNCWPHCEWPLDSYPERDPFP